MSVLPVIPDLYYVIGADGIGQSCEIGAGVFEVKLRISFWHNADRTCCKFAARVGPNAITSRKSKVVVLMKERVFCSSLN